MCCIKYHKRIIIVKIQIVHDIEIKTGMYIKILKDVIDFVLFY